MKEQWVIECGEVDGQKQYVSIYDRTPDIKKAKIFSTELAASDYWWPGYRVLTMQEAMDEAEKPEEPP